VLGAEAGLAGQGCNGETFAEVFFDVRLNAPKAWNSKAGCDFGFLGCKNFERVNCEEMARGGHVGICVGEMEMPALFLEKIEQEMNVQID